MVITIPLAGLCMILRSKLTTAHNTISVKPEYRAMVKTSMTGLQSAGEVCARLDTITSRAECTNEIASPWHAPRNGFPKWRKSARLLSAVLPTCIISWWVLGFSKCSCHGRHPHDEGNVAEGRSYRCVAYGTWGGRRREGRMALAAVK